MHPQLRLLILVLRGPSWPQDERRLGAAAAKSSPPIREVAGGSEGCWRSAGWGQRRRSHRRLLHIGEVSISAPHSPRAPPTHPLHPHPTISCLPTLLHLVCRALQAAEAEIVRANHWQEVPVSTIEKRDGQRWVPVAQSLGDTSCHSAATTAARPPTGIVLLQQMHEDSPVEGSSEGTLAQFSSSSVEGST